jgi:hypothetical protein
LAGGSPFHPPIRDRLGAAPAKTTSGIDYPSRPSRHEC